jgi:hypothetical protein
MVQAGSNADTEQIVEPMIALARCSIRHRIVITGTHGADFMFALHRRGYAQVAITANSPLANGQYDVALIDWRHKPIEGLETVLDWLLDFLDPAGAVVMCVDPQGPSADREIRNILAKRGLKIELGSRCEASAAISGWRRETKLAQLC